jgi:hypothetical protein
MLIYKTEYFSNVDDAFNYLKSINYLTKNLEDWLIMYYANLNKDRELGHAKAICEVANPKNK